MGCPSRSVLKNYGSKHRLACTGSLAKLPRVMALHKGVAERPRLKVYLASERRVPFKETGIFRRYLELDG